MHGEDPVPGCASCYKDTWGHVWRCDRPWGHIEMDMRIVHSALVPVSFQHAIPTYARLSGGNVMTWTPEQAEAG